ncbi:hypothetical protein O0L34_g14041 [Tuta absoluta]|nr:hypothetical protein O0L34_g14041 [Tuta absoluta]
MQVEGFAFAKETCEEYLNNLERCKEIFNDFKDKIGKDSDTQFIRSHSEDFPMAYSQCKQVERFASVKETCEEHLNNLERCKEILNDFKDKIGKGSDTQFIRSYCEDFPRAYSQCKQVE